MLLPECPRPVAEPVPLAAPTEGAEIGREWKRCATGRRLRGLDSEDDDDAAVAAEALAAVDGSGGARCSWRSVPKRMEMRCEWRWTLPQKYGS